MYEDKQIPNQSPVSLLNMDEFDMDHMVPNCSSKNKLQSLPLTTVCHQHSAYNIITLVISYNSRTDQHRQQLVQTLVRNIYNVKVYFTSGKKC